MIATLLLAASLAAAPEAASPTPSTSLSALSEKVTIEVKDASLKDFLEKIAVLLDATPIFEPGIDGTVTLSAKEMPVSDLLAKLQKDFGIRIDVQTGAQEHRRQLVVSRTPGAAVPTPRPVLEGAPGALKFGFQTERGPRVWRELGAFLAPVSLPGCAEPPKIALLRSDDDGRIVFPDGQGRARIVVPGGSPFRLPGCRDPFALESTREPVAAEAAVRPTVQFPQFMTAVGLFEVGLHGEEVLTYPKVQSILGQVFQVRSGSSPAPGAADPPARDIRISGIILEASETEALLALSVTIDGEASGQEKVRISQSDETLRIGYGKPERVTLSSTYGGGRSALVAELTVTLMRKPPR